MRILLGFVISFGAFSTLAIAQPSQVSEFFDGPLMCTTVDFSPGKGLENDWNLKQNVGRVYTLLVPSDTSMRVRYKWGIHDQEMQSRSLPKILSLPSN